MGWNGNVVLRCTGKTFFLEVYNNVVLRSKKVNSNYYKLLNRGGDALHLYPQSLAIFQESKYLSYKSSPFGLLYSLS